MMKVLSDVISYTLSKAPLSCRPPYIRHVSVYILISAWEVRVETSAMLSFEQCCTTR